MPVFSRSNSICRNEPGLCRGTGRIQRTNRRAPRFLPAPRRPRRQPLYNPVITLPPAQYPCRGGSIVNRPIIHEKFNSRLAEGWKNGYVPEIDGKSSNFLGLYGQDDYPTSKTFNVPTYTEFIRLQFDLYELDKYDGKGKSGAFDFYFFINNRRMSVGTFKSEIDEGSRSGVEGGIIWNMTTIGTDTTFNETYNLQKHQIVADIPKGYFRRSKKINVRFKVDVTDPKFEEAAGFAEIKIFTQFPCSECVRELEFASEDFEDGDASLWTDQRIVNEANKTLTNFLGPFSMGNTTGRRFRVPYRPSKIRLEFDFYELDDWNGFDKKEGRDFFNAYVDNDRLDFGYFVGRLDEGPRYGKSDEGIEWTMKSKTRPYNLNSNNSAPDQIHHVVANIPPEFYLQDESLEVFFEFKTSSGAHDESGGIDNVKLTAIYEDCKGDPPPEPDFKALTRKQNQGFKWPSPPSRGDLNMDFRKTMEQYLHAVLTEAIRFHYGIDYDSCLYDRQPTVFVNLKERDEWLDAKPLCNATGTVANSTNSNNSTRRHYF